MKWLDSPTKVLTFAVAIAALTWTVMQIVDRVEQPSEELTAEVSVSPFILPTTLQSSMLLTDGNQNALRDLRDFGSQLFIIIHNSGQKTLSDITLRLPDECLVEAYPKNLSPKVLDWSDEVNIGTMKPGEFVKVVCWSENDDPLHEENFSTLDYEENGVSLVHSDGIGKVKKMVTVPNTPWITFAEHPYLITIFNISVCWVVLSLMLKISDRIGKTKK